MTDYSDLPDVPDPELTSPSDVRLRVGAVGVCPAALHPGPVAVRPVAAPWRQAGRRPYSGAVNRTSKRPT